MSEQRINLCFQNGLKINFIENYNLYRRINLVENKNNFKVVNKVKKTLTDTSASKTGIINSMTSSFINESHYGDSKIIHSEKKKNFSRTNRN